jgi:hypothetical protein
MIEIQVFQHIKTLMRNNEVLKAIPFLTYLSEETQAPVILFAVDALGKKCVSGRIEIFSSYKGLQEILKLQKEIAYTLEASPLTPESPLTLKVKALEPMKESVKSLLKSAIEGRTLTFMAKLN